LYNNNYEYNNTLTRFTVVKSSYKLLTRLTETIYGLFLLQGPSEYDDDLYDQMRANPLYQIKALGNNTNRFYVEKYCAITPKILFKWKPYHIRVDVCGNQWVTANRFLYLYRFPFNNDKSIATAEFLALVLFGGK